MALRRRLRSRMAGRIQRHSCHLFIILLESDKTVVLGVIVPHLFWL